MAYTQADLDAIKKTIASGALRVNFADRSIEYRSMADLLKAKAEIESELNPSSGSTAIRMVRIIPTSGF